MTSLDSNIFKNLLILKKFNRKRSNALLNYSNKLVYYEGLKFPGFFYGFNFSLGLVIFGTCLFFPPLRFLLKKYVLPKPGP